MTIARGALLVLLPVIAILALTRRRRLAAIIAMGLFSLILAGVYLLAHAPDVAITEASIGAALVTFVYVLAIRRTGRLVVVGTEVPGLLQREGARVGGLEHEILAGFARHLGLDLVVRLVSREDVVAAVAQGEADIGGGGLVAGGCGEGVLETRGYLPTAVFRVSRAGQRDVEQRSDELARGYLNDVTDAVRGGKGLDVSLDLARFVCVSRLDLSGYVVNRLPGECDYTFILPSGREEMQRRLTRYLEGLRESGELDRAVGRHLT